MDKTYINTEIIEGFRNKPAPFNYQKLIILLEAINRNYKEEDAHTCSILLRAVLDHIPPLLGKFSFEEVAKNYSWGESKKKYMLKLLEYKNVGDDVLHSQISEKTDFVTLHDLPSAIFINTLLDECLSRSVRDVPVKPRTESMPKLQVELFKDEARWDHYATEIFKIWNSFNLILIIDNTNNPNPEYLSAKLIANNWVGDQFLFEQAKPDINKKLEVEPKKLIHKVGLNISDHLPGDDRRVPKPDFDIDSLKLLITTLSGKTIEIEIKPAWITG